MAGKSPLSDEQWQNFHKRALAGEPFTVLDAEAGFTNGAVRKMLTRKYGFPRQQKTPPMSWEQSDAINVRLQQGESLGAIAREIGHPSSGNLYRLMMNRYGYKASDIRYRPVWAPTIKLDRATETDLAYIAGIIDGEGSIIHLWRARSHPIWVVKVGMTDRPVIEWLHSFGGSFGVDRPARPRRLAMYKWSMSRQIDVRMILEAVLPYLKVKRHLADEALADLASKSAKCDWTPKEIANGTWRSPRNAKQVKISRMPRRAAHAAYALLEAASAAGDKGPFTAADVFRYDTESSTPRHTAAALTSAWRHGLAERRSDGWLATTRAWELQRELGDRVRSEVALIPELTG